MLTVWPIFLPEFDRINAGVAEMEDGDGDGEVGNEGVLDSDVSGDDGVVVAVSRFMF